jgi:hypothetical protein
MKNVSLRSPMRLLGLLICLVFESIGAAAQSIDLANIAKAKPLQVSGGFGANTVFSAGLPNNNQPFNYFLNGNLNFNILGTINIPLSFNYSNQKIALSQGYSFNQLSISPTYKWITAHIGTNYMSFSPYTLNGHQFVGGGLELSPNKWKIQMMAGRLIKGQFEDTTTTGPTFKRMGYGTKIEYNPGTYVAGITLFKAFDDASTVPELRRIFNKKVVNPEDNMVVSLNFGTTLFHALQFNIEYANSVVTKDQRPEYDRVKVRSLAGIFHRGNATTQSFNALKTNLNYNIKATGTIVGVGYEEIDPDYRTLGGYFFVNDLRNYTFNASQTLYGGKVSLAGNIGIQQDDIKKTKVNNQNRFVGSLNANAQVSEGLMMGVNFSNFQSYRFLNDTYSRITRVPGQIIDTLAFAMVSRTFGYNLSKSFVKTETKETSLNFNLSLIGSENKRANVLDPQSKTNIINSSLTYAIAYPTQQASINTTLTYFRNVLFNGTLTGLGPTIGFQKTFVKKLNTTLNLSALNVNNTMAGIDKANSLALNAQISANMTAGKSHNFNFNTGVVANNGQTFLNGNLGYNYSF